MKISLSICFLACTTAFSPVVTRHTSSSIAPLEATNTRRDVIGAALVGSVAFVSTSASVAAPLPTYLSEPTDEFKKNEEKAMVFKREQLRIKAQFNKVLERFSTESKTEAEFEKDINELQDLVVATRGLPLGIKKDELFKIIRRKKAAGPWPTKVEYAYQELIREIAYQQNPNTEKDEANPL
mmetsp:Transcript_1708/g.2528  ORF Transcript_1708/g.2528 Transcript_1708/m.2528 type:complete len:182 (-) Transcript_1708:534-1079(-)|eukprot:CAMPEP_0194209964 /NCGR_PEP_ID=MMETSP0156-20130528/7911_1 /TAXON_ID=33649 /ORGANISM="Thalassionema nitzschioides, Strain L26-B" /LENGTH=181 /DNA_ID=CAMNT_0038937229 /DNA_START=34 /DNA_END=579 /DNA_ORIENTATION=-